MTRGELQIWICSLAVIVLAHWAFTFPVDRSGGLRLQITAAAAVNSADSANEYCKKTVGKVRGILKCSESTNGESTRGFCTAKGECDVTEYQDQNGIWKPISGRGAQAGTSQSTLPAPAFDEFDMQRQNAAGPSAPPPSSTNINCAFGVNCETVPTAQQEQTVGGNSGAPNTTGSENAGTNRTDAGTLAPLTLPDVRNAVGLSPQPSTPQEPETSQQPVTSASGPADMPPSTFSPPVETGAETLITQDTPPAPPVDPQIAEKVLTKELDAETAKTNAIQAQLSAMTLSDRGFSSSAGDYVPGNDYAQVQAALDAQKAAQADAQNALDAYKATGVLSGDDKIKVLSTQEQLANGPGTVWSAIGSVKDFFTNNGNSALNSLSDPNIDNQPPEVAAAYALGAGTSYVLGGIVGEAQKGAELVSTPDENRVWDCVTGCTTERVMGAVNTAALVYGGWEAAVGRAVGEVAIDGVAVGRTLAGGGDLADAAAAIRGTSATADTGTGAVATDAAVSGASDIRTASGLPSVESPTLVPREVPVQVDAAPSASIGESAAVRAEVLQPPLSTARLDSVSADAPLSITRIDEAPNTSPLAIESNSSPKPLSVSAVAEDAAFVPAQKSAYFDNRIIGDSALRDLSAPEPAPSLKIANINGTSIEVSATSFPSDAQNIVQTPAQYEALMKEYVPGDNPTFIPADKWTQVPYGKGTAIDTQSVVLVQTENGVREIDRLAYNNMRYLGDEVYRVPEMRAQTTADTAGRIAFSEPSAFPSTFDFQAGSLQPASALTPPSAIERWNFIDTVSDAASKIPTSVWEKLPDKPIQIYDFVPQQGSESLVKAAGFANSTNDTLWVNPNGSVAQTFYHEVGHFMDNAGILPSDAKWGTTVYGDQWPFAYGKEVSGNALKDPNFINSLSERPEGFARDYGYYGNIVEDKATMVEYMMRNYPAMDGAAQSDPVLAAKMQMVKDSLYNASNGEMNDVWWQSQRPLNPNLVIAPSAEAITRELEAWSAAPTIDTGFAASLTKAGGTVIGGIATEWTALQVYFNWNSQPSEPVISNPQQIPQQYEATTRTTSAYDDLRSWFTSPSANNNTQ